MAVSGLFGNNTYKGVDARWQTDDNTAAAEPFIGAKDGIAVQTRVKDRVSTFKEIRPQPFLLKTPRFWRQDGGDGGQRVRVTVAAARFGVITRTNPPCQRRCKLQKAVPSNITFLKDLQVCSPDPDFFCAHIYLAFLRNKNLSRKFIHDWIREIIMYSPRKLASTCSR